MDEKKWTNIHIQLHELMKKEMETMRHLLENMHQEEFFILRKEKNHWDQMMEERKELISQLSLLRQNRLLTIETLESMFIPSSMPAPLEELLPPNHDSSWEILLLRDQISSLLERLSLQTSRNHLLTQLDQYTIRQPSTKKNKTSIATMNQEGYKTKKDEST